MIQTKYFWSDLGFKTLQNELNEFLTSCQKQSDTFKLIKAYSNGIVIDPDPLVPTVRVYAFIIYDDGEYE
ncbi:MAG: hypothetical protein ACTHME_00890 [Candidatus Nitrosocosmicus sp.]